MTDKISDLPSAFKLGHDSGGFTSSRSQRYSRQVEPSRPDTEHDESEVMPAV